MPIILLTETCLGWHSACAKCGLNSTQFPRKSATGDGGGGACKGVNCSQNELKMVDSSSVQHGVVLACGSHSNLTASLPCACGSARRKNARDHNCGIGNTRHWCENTHARTQASSATETPKHLQHNGGPEVLRQDGDARGPRPHLRPRTQWIHLRVEGFLGRKPQSWLSSSWRRPTRRQISSESRAKNIKEGRRNEAGYSAVKKGTSRRGVPTTQRLDWTVSSQWELTGTSCYSFGLVSPTQLSQLHCLRGLVVSRQRKGPWSSPETAKMSWAVQKGAGCGINSFSWRNTRDPIISMWASYIQTRIEEMDHLNISFQEMEQEISSLSMKTQGIYKPPRGWTGKKNLFTSFELRL